MKGLEERKEGRDVVEAAVEDGAAHPACSLLMFYLDCLQMSSGNSINNK